MKKIKCTVKYHDKMFNKDIEIGEEYEVDEARASVLINAHVAEEVTTPTEVVTKAAPKKKSAPKKKEA